MVERDAEVILGDSILVVETTLLMPIMEEDGDMISVSKLS